MSDETVGLDQPDGCQEGPFINRPPGWVHSFYGISEDLSLRERCMREICTCSVSGGRRPARKRASSAPTMRLLLVCPVNRGSRSSHSDCFHLVAYLATLFGL